MGSDMKPNETKTGIEVSSKHDDTRPTILLTGFGPFSTFKENPAWLAIQALEKMCKEELPWKTINFVFRKIPVEYETVKNTLPSWWNELKPKAIIHVGTGYPDGSLHIEKKAFNKGYCAKDVDGRVPCDNHYVENGPASMETDFDVDAIVKEMNSKMDQLEGLCPAKVSMNPGRYLCGFIYYQSLNKYSSRSLFIHVPPIDKEKCVTAENLARGLKHAILAIVKQLGLGDEL